MSWRKGRAGEDIVSPEQQVKNKTHLGPETRPSSSTLNNDPSDGRWARRFDDWREIVKGGFTGRLEADIEGRG